MAVVGGIQVIIGSIPIGADPMVEWSKKQVIQPWNIIVKSQTMLKHTYVVSLSFAVSYSDHGYHCQ